MQGARAAPPRRATLQMSRSGSGARMRALQLLLGGLCGAAAPFSAPRLSPDTDALHYNLGKTATPHTGRCGTPDKPAACPPVTVNRTLTDRLADQISVLDFGATASCHGDTLATCQHDSTQAFVDAVLYAGGEDSSPFDFQTVVVPPGCTRYLKCTKSRGMILKVNAVMHPFFSVTHHAAAHSCSRAPPRS